MAGTEMAIVRLSDLVDGQEGVFFALLTKKTRGTTSRNQPYIRCFFRDKHATLEAPLWHDHRFHDEADGWAEGIAYRVRARCDFKLKYGLQLDLIEIRPARDGDEGYNLSSLVPCSDLDPEELFRKIQDLVQTKIDDPYLKRLVSAILSEHAGPFKTLPAAQNMHHSYMSGLIEHIWSMTRIATFLAEHYGKYYVKLDPPLSRSMILAATILHDIGKLRELDYHGAEARYTKEGRLVGHVLMGRDMVREAASRIEGFPVETLLLLEHAILSHHGRREFGAPVIPLTLEALIVSYIDDLDAKVNVVADKLLHGGGDGDFTEKLYALDNRQFYKGIPGHDGTPGDSSDGTDHAPTNGSV